MIHRIYSDLPKGKNLIFKPGLNVLLAEKSRGATDKQTRNRAGKSSLLDIVHFLLGSNCDKDSIFRSDALRNTTFGMEFDLGGAITRSERTGSRPSPLVVEGDFLRWPVPPFRKGDHQCLSNDNWKSVLGKLMFGIEEIEGAWGPSFRSIMSYFARRERDGGMEQPTTHFRQQRPIDQQVNLSFLIGLDWSIPRNWQTVRDREKTLEQLKKGIAEGALGNVIGAAAEIKSELIIAQDRLSRQKTAIASFRVVDQYHELERTASEITSQIALLGDENVLDHRHLNELERTTVEEVPPVSEDLEGLYRQAGVILPEMVRRRFTDVMAFHESVVKNRRAYLRAEIDATKQRLEQRNSQKSQLDARRSELMAMLKTAGALEHFTALQAELSRSESHVEELRRKYDVAEALESGGLKLKVERAHLLERLRQDYTEQDEVIREAVLTFSEISSGLYGNDNAGSLTIRPTDNGPEFDPHIPGEKSKGVNNIKIFCFDIMLMLLGLRRGRNPGFLIHDSHLFDGVDERQVGKALALGARLAKEHGFQYIVTMNTDSIPSEVPPGFRIEDYALPVRLSDASEDGGLFGFRFD